MHSTARRASFVESSPSGDLSHTFNDDLARIGQQLEFGGGNWTRLGFTLTPSSAALCDGIAPMSDPDIPCGDDGSTTVGHLCVRCTGQFVIGLSSPGDAFVDFAVLQPGAWGRAAGPGGPLPVLVEAVDTLKTMGVTTIRQGGSFVSYYGDYCRPLSVQQASAPRRPAHPPTRPSDTCLPQNNDEMRPRFRAVFDM